MRFKLPLVLFSPLLVIASCSKSTQPPANGAQSVVETSSPLSASPSPASLAGATPATEAAATKPSLDACALLTSKEIESVQGEPVKETKLTGQSTGGFSISQCFFTLPTFTNSVSLLVAQKGEGAGANDPKEFWRDTFHEDKAKEKDKDRDRKGDRDKKRGEEEEEGAPPQKITGIGDEAYWTGSRVGGAIYVLKRNAYVRISIGGPADQATKIKKSKALAQKAIARL
jgi:hypothetical protein